MGVVLRFTGHQAAAEVGASAWLQPPPPQRSSPPSPPQPSHARREVVRPGTLMICACAPPQTGSCSGGGCKESTFQNGGGAAFFWAPGSCGAGGCKCVASTTTTTTVNKCANQDCSGHGDCAVDGNTFKCTCNRGWGGATCKDNIEGCPGQDCGNEISRDFFVPKLAPQGYY